jgi:hypothetical protein
MAPLPPSTSDMRVAKIIIGGFLAAVFCGLMLYLYVYNLGSGLGEHFAMPAPDEMTAVAHVQETRVAVAKDIVPSLVSETGVITSVFLPTGWANVYYDGARVWASYDTLLIALDPQTREVSLGPIGFDEPVEDMISDGRQLWVRLLDKLYPVDPVIGKVGPAVQADGRLLDPLAYDGTHLWFVTCTRVGGNCKTTLQGVDPVSREALPPIETNSMIWRLVADEARHVLWIINAVGEVQQYDLWQNALRDSSLKFESENWINHGADVCFDGQRLLAFYKSKIGNIKNVGQALNVDTGETTDLTASMANNVTALLCGNKIWIGGTDWTVQSIDAATGQSGLAIPVQGYPGDLAFDGQRLWVALYEEVFNAGRHFVGLQYLVPKEKGGP